MPDTVVVTAVFVPQQGRQEEARSAILGALADVHAESGCELYALHDAADGSLVLIEKWESAELLDAHGSGEPVARLGKAVSGLLEKPPVVARMTPVPGGDAAKGRL
ncbi:putative quinol monooxygenase [Pseudonocardia sp. MH-G8]|uniref:putative quinol monooxygenase n=1 Tax=Pseudonocardia sp. MH-G8 TaxID=1854588 RepID=UPI000BA04E35|nr:antibiotic biosynthesis monooxygenase [Pseudonocardia sp. MH-G8]OZM77355.1 antibiotic biosynthesis monooxygenase [Pseudonocardia sp. MH-G8]